MDIYGFYMGKEFEAYKYLGAHTEEKGTVFRTYAPNADHICVTGEFNGWTETPMQKVNDGNFWECRIENAVKGMMYKYRIYAKNKRMTEHSDPYGFYCEVRPNTASIILDRGEFYFDDLDWMKRRTVCLDQPMNIYEMHFGSWKKKLVSEMTAEKYREETPEHPEEWILREDGSYGKYEWYTYKELAELLIPYLKEYGYNYLELMPLSEHPCDESWGYQNTGFFAPTSRYGTPDELKYFINACHKNDIGVIMDFVPVHFAANGDALMQFDGTAVYEYPHKDIAFSEWGSCNFMHTKGEVRSFLQSSANYWLTEFHFDGLRMDAVRNLIYWQGNEARGVNKLAIQFLQTMNQGLKERHPSCILMAEDSSSYPGVTKASWAGGLGFDYKWDMGWMNDTLNYFRTDPYFRCGAYHTLTFSMMYYYNENYVLPLSHDEVVHGKATIMQRMYGQYEDKFPQGRCLYMYMYAHPGKKLNFMGNELAQLREWDEKREQDWDMLRYPKHDEFHQFMKDLNKIYLENPAFWQDYGSGNFQWLDCHQETRCIYAIERKCENQRILAVFNFSGIEQKKYELKIPGAGKLKLLLTSDDLNFRYNHPEYEKVPPVKDEKAVFDLPPFSARYYEIYCI